MISDDNCEEEKENVSGKQAKTSQEQYAKILEFVNGMPVAFHLWFIF